MKQADEVMERCSLVIGQFVMAWARIEIYLRALDFMHVGNHDFEPVTDFHAIDLKKSLRFRERVNLLPDRIEGARFDIRDWLIGANKLRNLIIHGELIFLETGGEGVATPAIIHSDLKATMVAGKGFPTVTESHMPSYRRSASPDKIVDVPKLERFPSQAKHVEEVLFNIICKIHGIDLNR